MIGRLLVYFKEMFPLTALIGTVLMAFSFTLALGKLVTQTIPTFHWQLLVAGFSVSSISLLIRVMDEFKDFEDDLKNFPNRPLPSGRVLKSDLIFLGWSCVALHLILSLIIDRTILFYWAIATLIFTFLMLKWFFIENRMRKSLPLAFISHHPIILFNFVYLAIVAMVVYGPEAKNFLPYILPICLIFTNWEISRKIRTPAQETSYTTYSKIWGPKVAASICVILQLVFTGFVSAILVQMQVPLWFLGLFILAIFYFMKPYLVFLSSLKLHAPLKASAEQMVLLVMLTLLISVYL